MLLARPMRRARHRDITYGSGAAVDPPITGGDATNAATPPTPRDDEEGNAKDARTAPAAIAVAEDKLRRLRRRLRWRWGWWRHF